MTAAGKVALFYDHMQRKCTKNRNGQIVRKQRTAWSLWVDKNASPVDGDE